MHIVGENIKCYSYYEKQYGCSLEKKKKKIILSSDHFTSGFLSIEDENTNLKRYLYLHIYNKDES